jgi:replicative DNA helicase
MFERQMPFSMEAEQALLGSILIDPACLDSTTASRSDFYLPEHAEIFTAMQKMYIESRSIDVVTLIDTLTQSGTYDEAGGRSYLTVIAGAVPTASNAEEYAKIVRDKATLRRIIESADNIAEAAYSGESAESVSELAESSFAGIADSRERRDFVPIQEGILQVYKTLNNLRDDPEKYRGVSTGFPVLDSVIIGMSRSDLILVGARPGMGKTSFVMNIASHAAQKTEKTVVVFSLEMSSEQLVNRMLCSEACIPSYVMRTGELTTEQSTALAHASSRLSETKIVIDDTPGISVAQMRSRLRRVKDLGLVVIDYLQLMQSDTQTANRVQEVGEISRGLKLLAKELDVPVICCAQLSRSPESRPDKRPMLSDLRESGSIEQDADVVMFLYRDEYYDKNDKNDKNDKSDGAVAEVIVAKNRHGSLDNVKLGWIGPYTKFVNLA